MGIGNIIGFPPDLNLDQMQTFRMGLIAVRQLEPCDPRKGAIGSHSRAGGNLNVFNKPDI